MKKALVLLLVALCMVGTAVAVVISAETAPRTVEFYGKELMALSGADKVGAVIKPERNEIRYPFLPLYKGGKLIGYGTWVSLTIYQHPEDLIVIVNPNGTLQNFKAIDANEKHPGMHDEKWKSKFYGMTKDRDFINATDVNAGSTISTYLMFGEMKTILLVFEKYVTKL